MITKTLFDKYNDRDVYLYTIENGDIKVGVLDFGGILNFIKLNTFNGEKNILIGYDCVEGYLNSKAYVGATVGRVANRIAGSKFTLDDKEWHISSNEGKNCLHGGVEGFDKRFYDVEVNGDTLTLSLTSPDGDMGFPGELKFNVEFALNGRELTIKYSGLSDKNTLFSPTCHAYFNMNGEGAVMGNLLKINAQSYTPVDEPLIPIGTIESVKGTPLDFTAIKPIGKDLAELGGKTYDHNFCLSGNPAAIAHGEISGITMELNTDLPGLQFYVGKPVSYNGNGGGYGFCLEPQFFPNAVNVDGFETPLLKSNAKKTYTVRYTFGF